MYSIVATPTVVYVGGAFTLVNLLTARNRIAAFPPTSNTPQAWNPNANGTVRTIALSGTDVFFGGDFNMVSATARNHIALVNASGVLQSWSRELNGDVFCLAVANNTLYAGGDFTLVDGLGRQRLAAFGVPSSGLPTVTDWSPATESTVLCIAAQGGARFAGGVFQRGGGLSRRNIVAFDPPPVCPPHGHHKRTMRFTHWSVQAQGLSSPVASQPARRHQPYGPCGDDPVSGDALPWSVALDTIHVTDLAVKGDTLFVCGAFRSIGGQTREHLAALSITSAAALPWNVPLGAADEPMDILLDNDTLFVCGHITSIGGQPRKRVGSIKVSTATVLTLAVDFVNAGSAWQLAKAGGRLFISGLNDDLGFPVNANLVLDAITGAAAPYSISGYQCVTAHEDRFYVADQGHVVCDARTGIALASRFVPDFFALDTIRHATGIHSLWVTTSVPQTRLYTCMHPCNTIRVMLDGPFLNGAMENPCAMQRYFRLSSPYTALAVHSGNGGGEVAPANIHTLSLDGSAGTEVVDWVLVEYRDPLDPANIVSSLSGLLLRNGTIRTSNWEQLPSFSPNPNGSYYVAVRHRNHLGVMTAQPVDFSRSPFIDFSLPATPVYGNNARKTSSGVGTLWCGDVNFDGTIKYTGSTNDRDPLLVRIGGSVPTNTANGYHNEDVNMDGLVKYTGSTQRPGSDPGEHWRKCPDQYQSGSVAVT
ncbi:MAG: hypothetical protein IPJ85_14290 [Flavobacteriales bacterium]|nr:hypothetical protein [Flavobacteriales bacterium]